MWVERKFKIAKRNLFHLFARYQSMAFGTIGNKIWYDLMSIKDPISTSIVLHNLFILLIREPDSFVMLKRVEEKAERAYFLASTESKSTRISKNSSCSKKSYVRGKYRQPWTWRHMHTVFLYSTQRSDERLQS